MTHGIYQNDQLHCKPKGGNNPGDNTLTLLNRKNSIAKLTYFINKKNAHLIFILKPPVCTSGMRINILQYTSQGVFPIKSLESEEPKF